MSRIAHDLASSPHNPFPPKTTNTEQAASRSMQRLCIERIPHVAVVGTGISGLRCADVLLRAGARVTMFEARDRIGGRVHQIKSGGYLMDTGPNWIHGTEGNPISQLAQLTSTVVMEPNERQLIFDSSGKALNEQDSVKFAAEVWGTILKAFKHSDEHSAQIDVNESLFDFFRSEYVSKFKEGHEKIEILLKEASMWGPFVGEKVERQSLKFFFLEQCLEGDTVFVASTYHKILAEVAKVALKDANIRFEEPVSAVRYREADDGNSVQLETKNGTYDFDEVVVTCPLGWLKRNKSKAFSPPLPSRLSEAIDNIGYGRLEKLYITFPSAFWLSNSDSCSTPSFVHFHHPAYHPSSESRGSTSWNQSVVSLAHLPSSTAHPTLLFYMYGDCGTYLTNLLQPHAPHSATYNQLLTAFAEPFFSKLPNYSPDSPACQPTSFLATAWQQDPYAGHGSYSNFPVGLEQADKDIEAMRNAGGLSEAGCGLWLAGEHTAPFVAVGTTTGAWWSGEGVARRIARQYGLKVDQDDLNGTVTEAKKNPVAHVHGNGNSVANKHHIAPPDVEERTVNANSV